MKDQATHVVVTATRDRWRAGIQFKSNQPAVLRISDLAEGALDKLEADPVLSLRFKTEETEPVAAPDAPTGNDPPVATEPTDPDERQTAILNATLALEPDGFNKDGSPSVGALETALGWKPAKFEITSALGEMTDEQRDFLKARLETV